MGGVPLTACDAVKRPFRDVVAVAGVVFFEAATERESVIGGGTWMAGQWAKDPLGGLSFAGGDGTRLDFGGDLGRGPE